MLLLVAVLLVIPTNAQEVNIQPLIELLRPESMNRMAAIATELSSLAAANMRNNEKQIKETQQQERDLEIPTQNDNRPSRILGQVMSDATDQSRDAFIRALAPLADYAASSTPGPEQPALEPSSPPEASTESSPSETVPSRPESAGLPIQQLEKTDERIVIVTPGPRQQAAPIQKVDPVAPLSPTDPLGAEVRLNPSNPLGVPAETSGSPVQAQKGGPNALLKIAEAFLGGNRQGGSGEGTTNAAKEMMSLGIRDFIPGSDKNFGIPKGKGCLPFLSEFMQVAYGNCQEVADERAFDAWASELRSAILTGQIDILKASQETCRRGAERQQCASLRRSIADCDIMKSLTVGGQLQRAMQRCEDVGGLVDQDPIMVLGQLNRLIGGEVAQGFFNNFLTGKPT